MSAERELVREILEQKKEQIREQIQIRKARESFEDYCRFVGGVEPARHHQIMCKAFQPIADGESKLIMLNAPPGSAKSTYASHLFPAYYVGKTGKLVISGCHTYGLSESFGKKVRNYVSSENHLKVFPASTIRRDTRASSDWATNNGGEYYGVGVGGGVAGKRADLLIVEDPYPNKRMAKSPAYQKTVREWFTADVMPRLRPGASVIVIFTRWDIADLARDIYEIEEATGVPWEKIKFEAICEHENEDPLGRKVGEPLWPEWQSLKDLIFIKNTTPPDEWQSLYQQRPTSTINLEGSEIEFRFYDPLNLPKFRRKFQSWDTASAETGNYSAGITFGIHGMEYYVLDCLYEKLAFPDLVNAFYSYHRKHRPDLVYVEKKGSGISLIQTVMGKVNVKGIDPRKYGSKMDRFEFTTPIIQGGRVLLPKSAPWLGEFLDQIIKFMDGMAKYDDIPDAFSQGLREEEPLIGNYARRRRRMVPLEGAT
jgi:predicted phage terminase large subunit-like protein